MKKLLSLVLVLAMVLGLSVTAFAAASGTGTENDPYLLSTLEVNDVIIATDYIKNNTEEILDYEVRYIDSETEQQRAMTIQPNPGETKQFTNSYYYPDNTQFSYKGFDPTVNDGSGAYVFEQITPEEEEGKSGTTNITATKAAPAPLSYEIVIPTNVAAITNFGVYAVGQAKVENVENATDNTVISYTAETTDFKCEGKTNIPATYYTEQDAENDFPTTAVTVYENKATATNIPTMYVKIAENDWNAADPGTYKATVTYNFSAEETPAIRTIGDVLATLDGEFPMWDANDESGYWISDGKKCYLSMNNNDPNDLHLKFKSVDVCYSGLDAALPVTQDENCYKYTSGTQIVTFNMESGKLVSIGYSDTNESKFNGTYYSPDVD